MIVMAHMARMKIARAISRLHPARRPWVPKKMRESLGRVGMLAASGRISDKGTSLRWTFLLQKRIYERRLGGEDRCSYSRSFGRDSRALDMGAALECKVFYHDRCF